MAGRRGLRDILLVKNGMGAIVSWREWRRFVDSGDNSTAGWIQFCDSGSVLVILTVDAVGGGLAMVVCSMRVGV